MWAFCFLNEILAFMVNFWPANTKQFALSLGSWQVRPFSSGQTLEPLKKLANLTLIKSFLPN